MKKKDKKRKPWIRFRHRVVTAILRFFLRPVIRLRYGIRVRRFRDKRQMLVMMNHQTAFDQFFIALTLGRTVYYLASEDLFSLGRLSRLITYLVAPIPIRKSMSDVRAVMTSMRVAREGGTIAVFPEGNRTYSGRTGHIKESIAPFARALGLPIAVMRVEGGYGVHPRWSDKVRRGHMSAGVVRVVEPEEYAKMTDEELFALLSQELHVDEGRPGGPYRSKRSAEYLERALYYCPYCGFVSLRSEGCHITCTSCHRTVEYLPSRELRGVGFAFPYRFITEWYDAQCEAMRTFDPTPYKEEPIFSEPCALFAVVPNEKRRKVTDEAVLAAYADRYTISYGGTVRTVPYDSISGASVLGRNKLNIYVGAEILQIKADERFCAMKFMNLYYRVRNERNGESHAEFLGI